MTANDVFDFPALFQETQAEVVALLDELSHYMLSLTCKALHSRFKLATFAPPLSVPRINGGFLDCFVTHQHVLSPWQINLLDACVDARYVGIMSFLYSSCAWWLSNVEELRRLSLAVIECGAVTSFPGLVVKARTDDLRCSYGGVSCVLAPEEVASALGQSGSLTVIREFVARFDLLTPALGQHDREFAVGLVKRDAVELLQLWNDSPPHVLPYRPGAPSSSGAFEAAIIKYHAIQCLTWIASMHTAKGKWPKWVFSPMYLIDFIFSQKPPIHRVCEVFDILGATWPHLFDINSWQIIELIDSELYGHLVPGLLQKYVAPRVNDLCKIDQDNFKEFLYHYLYNLEHLHRWHKVVEPYLTPDMKESVDWFIELKTK